MMKKFATMMFVVATVMVVMTVPVFAAEADAQPAVSAPAPTAIVEMGAFWSLEKQTIEVVGIDYANHDYKVRLIDENGKTYTCQADANTHLPVNADGNYTVYVFKHEEGTKYSKIMETKVVVEGCKGYLGSSEVVDFEENQKFLNSEAIQKVLTNTEDYKIAQAAFKYLDKNWKYDYNRAATVKSWYVPNTDKNDEAKAGICYDYAAAYASIMRKAGIQCKVIFGYVQTRTGSVYHAWNEINLYGKWYIVDACWGEYANTNYVRSTSYTY